MYELARHDAAMEPMIGQKDAGWIVRFRFRGAIGGRHFDIATEG